MASNLAILKQLIAEDHPELVAILEQKETNDLLTALSENKRTSNLNIDEIVKIIKEIKQDKVELSPGIIEKIIEQVTPKKGVHYFDGKDGTNGINGQTPTREQLVALMKPLIPPLIPKAKDGKTPTEQEIVAIIKPLIPKVKNGTDGKDGKSVDAKEVLELIKKLEGDEATTFAKSLGKIIDISYIRNANTFMFNGKRYKTEELMHGGGSSGGGGVNNTFVDVPQSATPAINSDSGGIFNIVGLAQDITSMTTNLTGTPTAGQRMSIEITDNGTARAITWGSKFASTVAVTLPSTTIINTRLRALFEWSTVTSKWECIGNDNATGSGGTSISFETPVGTVNDSNVTFTVSNTPKYIIQNGLQYFAGAGYTLATLTITLDNPVGTGGFIRSAY